jgi:CRP/FNR family cyclic AMP-dependent transcriptional regulator
MMENNGLGRVFEDGQTIIQQGERDDCMYVVQDGLVEVVVDRDGSERVMAILGQGEFFGELALFDRAVRMATVRALGEARVLSVDKRNLMRRIHEDPSLVYRMLLEMSRRIRDLSAEVTRLDQELTKQVGG